MTAPASPVPLIGGWALAVGPEGVVKIGAFGGVLSIVSASGVLWADSLPASSTACDVTRRTPSARELVVMLQLPFPPTVVVPASTPST